MGFVRQAQLAGARRRAGAGVTLKRVLLRGTVITPQEEIPSGSVLVEDGQVTWVGPGEPADATGCERLGGDDAIIAPGFVDLQVNGFAGHDAADGVEAVRQIAARLPETGVTGFLPTIITAPLRNAARFPAVVAEAASFSASPSGGGQGGGARILGAHLEGPFLSPQRPGCHDATLMIEPSPENLRAILGNPPRLITLAPELPGGLEAVRTLTRAGAIVSAGHSNATYEQGRAAVDAGVRFGTHLFNAMSPLLHRAPGLPGALLTADEVITGLIADGHHVHEALLSIALARKGAGRIALTTDQVSAAGMPPGRYQLGGRDVISDGQTVRRKEGMLAGSVGTMPQLIRIAAGLHGSSLRTALTMASLTPARALGLPLGRITPGAPADLVVLGDDLKVGATLVAGKIVFQS
ncbi:MAG TPA: N-acetylglucosamine-6-phosphate deacetylase [Candidatus Dormibacteraeota bacterium]|nr:N-acetylglucosamine-6-phosphate deacetylase [Candidatus Dormibacteraeota bacterium]